MRRIERSTAFRRDYKRIAATPRHRNIGALLAGLFQDLAADTPLTEARRDHPLAGAWSGYRECHVKPDLLLIYRKPPGVLQLVRLGSHAELFRS